MTTAANTLSASEPKVAPTRVSGWAHLSRLYPYVMRHKTEVVIGMITQVGMELPARFCHCFSA